jgi:hypothetical protein
MSQHTDEESVTGEERAAFEALVEHRAEPVRPVRPERLFRPVEQKEEPVTVYRVTLLARQQTLVADSIICYVPRAFVTILCDSRPAADDAISLNTRFVRREKFTLLAATNKHFFIDEVKPGGDDGFDRVITVCDPDFTLVHQQELDITCVTVYGDNVYCMKFESCDEQLARLSAPSLVRRQRWDPMRGPQVAALQASSEGVYILKQDYSVLDGYEGSSGQISYQPAANGLNVPEQEGFNFQGRVLSMTCLHSKVVLLFEFCARQSIVVFEVNGEPMKELDLEESEADWIITVDGCLLLLGSAKRVTMFDSELKVLCRINEGLPVKPVSARGMLFYVDEDKQEQQPTSTYRVLAVCWPELTRELDKARVRCFRGY